MKPLLLACVVVSALVSSASSAPKEGKPEKVDERKLLEKYDKDNDRKLDKTELAAALKSLKRNVVTVKDDGWKKFDTDGDEKIEMRELKKIIEANAEPEVDPKDEAKDKKEEKKPSNGLTLRPPGTS